MKDITLPYTNDQFVCIVYTQYEMPGTSLILNACTISNEDAKKIHKDTFKKVPFC